jgi:hypothetical protein
MAADDSGPRTSLSPQPEASAGDGVRESLASLITKLAKGAVGLFSLSGILYGAGFLVLRSHFSFLGIWSGVPSGNASIIEEGGRFFFSLLMVPANIILQLFTSPKAGASLVIGLVVLAVLWDARRWVSRFFGKIAGLSSFGHPGSRLYALFPACFLVLALLLTCWLLFMPTYLRLLSLQDVLRSPDRLREAQAAIRGASMAYNTVAVRLFVAILIGGFLYRVAWPVARGTRALIVVQWLLVIAALATVPMAYGRAFLPTAYPTISYSGVPSDILLLIDQTPDTWIVWNTTRKQTEIIPKAKVALVSIGARKSLFEEE